MHLDKGDRWFLAHGLETLSTCVIMCAGWRKVLTCYAAPDVTPRQHLWPAPTCPVTFQGMPVQSAYITRSPSVWYSRMLCIFCLSVCETKLCVVRLLLLRKTSPLFVTRGQSLWLYINQLYLRFQLSRKNLPFVPDHFGKFLTQFLSSRFSYSLL